MHPGALHWCAAAACEQSSGPTTLMAYTRYINSPSCSSRGLNGEKVSDRFRIDSPPPLQERLDQCGTKPLRDTG
jgi:hypothetical protein